VVTKELGELAYELGRRFGEERQTWRAEIEQLRTEIGVLRAKLETTKKARQLRVVGGTKRRAA
jgi:hypothetical protein